MIDALRRIVGERHALGPDEVEPRYLDDETGGVAGRPAGLVKPGTTEQLATVMAYCFGVGQPVVVQGGRTGMTRGGMPRDGELILSLERLTAIEAIDLAAGTMTVGAGCLLETTQQAAIEAGWRLAVDIGARGSCTIGGMIATNAGGHQVLRFGMMREQVLGLEVVLADGTILSSMGAMLKNNSGYDLKQLFIGSEGTLGIVTRAVLRLRPQVNGRETALCALPDYGAAVRLLEMLEKALPGRLSAFEAMWRDFFVAACARIGGGSPFAGEHPLFVLVEAEGVEEGALAAALEPSFNDGRVADAILAQSEREHHRLWSYRDAIGELVSAMPIVEPFDVSAPITAIGDLVARIRQGLDGLPGCKPIFFGHIGDGNLHLALELDTEAQRPLAEAIVYDAVRDAQGSISAEHGIGMLKRQWLNHSRSTEEIAVMRAIRQTLDPKQILNRDRIF